MWTLPIAVEQLPITFTDPADTLTRGRPAEYITAREPGGEVVVVLDGGTEKEFTLTAGQTIAVSAVGIDASDCDLIVGNGRAPASVIVEAAAP